MLLLMASTVSFHSDSFIAKTDVIFPFMVAWKRVRKVDKSLDRGLYFGALLAATIRLAYIPVLVASSHFARFSEKSGLQNCFAR